MKIGENWSHAGRVVIGSDHPLYRALTPSRDTIAELERRDRAQAAAWARIRFMLMGGDGGSAG